MTTLIYPRKTRRHLLSLLWRISWLLVLCQRFMCLYTDFFRFIFTAVSSVKSCLTAWHLFIPGNDEKLSVGERNSHKPKFQSNSTLEDGLVSLARAFYRSTLCNNDRKISDIVSISLPLRNIRNIAKSLHFSISHTKNTFAFLSNFSRCCRANTQRHSAAFATIANIVQKIHIWNGGSYIDSYSKT